MAPKVKQVIKIMTQKKYKTNKSAREYDIALKTIKK